MTLLLFVFQSSLQSPFKSFLKNNDKSLSPKKEKSSRRLSALVGVFLKSCGNFGVRAVEGELFHLVEVTGEFFMVLGIFLSQYLSQSWGINIPVVKKKQTTCHNNKNMIYRENLKSTTWKLAVRYLNPLRNKKKLTHTRQR